jgi:hypothetical protein
MALKTIRTIFFVALTLALLFELTSCCQLAYPCYGGGFPRGYYGGGFPSQRWGR